MCLLVVAVRTLVEVALQSLQGIIVGDDSIERFDIRREKIPIRSSKSNRFQDLKSTTSNCLTNGAIAESRWAGMLEEIGSCKPKQLDVQGCQPYGS